MSFNKAVAVLGLVFLSACSLKVGETPKKDEDIKLAGADTGCLEGYDQVMRDYFVGRASAEQVNGLFSCASKSLELFVTHTRGKDYGLYHPLELKSFLEKYFLGEQKIPEGLLSEGLVLKQAVLGGRTSVLTVVEIAKTRELLELLRQQALRVLPYMPMSAEHLATMSTADVDALSRVLSDVGGVIGGFIQNTGGNYMLRNFENLLLEFEKIYETDQDEGIGPRFIREGLPALRAAKAVISATSEDKISAKEWKRLISVAGQGLGIYLRLQHVVAQEKSVFYSPGVDRLFALFKETRELIAEAISMHPNRVISFAHLENLLDGLDKIGYVPFGASKKESIKNSLRPLIQGLVGGSFRGSEGRDAGGITMGALNRITREVLLIYEGQLALQGIYRELGAAPDGPLSLGIDRAELLRVDLNHVVEKYTSRIPEISRTAVDEIWWLIKTFRPFYTADEREMYFETSKKIPFYTFPNITQLSWIKAWIRFMFTGYAKDLRRSQAASALTVDEWDTLFKDFFDFGTDVKFYDPRYLDSARSRVKEMNLFASIGNGDDMLDLPEGIELFAFMLSSKAMGSRIHKDLTTRCKIGPLDIMGQPTIEAICYFNEMDYHFSYFWDHMPGLVDFYSRLSTREKQEFLFNVQSAARRTADLNDMVESGDTESIAMLLHYIEAIFNRYDTDKSGSSKDRLDQNETKAAFPILKRELKIMVEERAGEKVTDDRLLNILIYLLKFEKEPPTETVWEKIEYVWWETWGDKTFAADRRAIMKIVAMLAAPKDRKKN